MSDPVKKFTVQEVSGPHRETQQLPAALRTERLVESLVETVSKLDMKVDKFDRALTTVAQDVSTLKQAHEERARKHSGGIQRVSENDAKQDSVIAQVLVEQKKQDASIALLHTKTDYQTKILEGGKVAATKVWQSPYAKWVLLLVLGYLAMVAKKHGVEVPMP